jgi:hypothetical protein
VLATASAADGEQQSTPASGVEQKTHVVNEQQLTPASGVEQKTQEFGSGIVDVQQFELETYGWQVMQVHVEHRVTVSVSVSVGQGI